MRKTIKITLAILAIIAIAAIIGFYSLTKSGMTPAYLNVEQGDVQVDTGAGWKQATDGMELSFEDKIKTSETGQATLILYESTIITIEPNTEVAIAELNKNKPIISQQGSTWNKFTGLNGLGNLELETPNAVITVRGTEFGVLNNEVPVIEGKVQVKNKQTGQTVQVEQGNKATIEGEQTEIKELTQQEKQAYKQKMQHTLETLEQVRERLIQKNKLVIKCVKNAANVNDEELRRQMNEMDEGKIDEDILLEKTPVKLEALEQFVALTKKIKEQKAALHEN